MQSHSLKVAVIGLGYVGLPLAVHIANAGFETIGCDHDTAHIANLSAGCDMREALPLSALPLPRNLRLTMHPPEGADVYLICVPTPHFDGMPDQSYVISACIAVGQVIKDGACVVIESTVMPGSTKREFFNAVARAKGDKNFHIAYSPERINPGPNSFYDMVKDTKLVGVEDQEASDTLLSVYSAVFSKVRIIPSVEAAELAKCFENAQRDMNIALMNELSMQCMEHGVPFDMVVKGLRTKASSPKFHSGLVGGHCIAVDPYYLHAYYQGESLAIRGRKMNDRFIQFLATKIALDGYERVLIVGRTYKAEVLDTRNSGAMALYSRLQAFNMQVDTHDKLLDGPYVGHAKYDLVVGAVNHDTFGPVNLFAYYRCQPTCDFVNVGGQFQKEQYEGFNKIINV